MIVIMFTIVASLTIVIYSSNMTIINDTYRVMLHMAISLGYDRNSQLYRIIVASKVINYNGNRGYNRGIINDCHLRP